MKTALTKEIYDEEMSGAAKDAAAAATKAAENKKIIADYWKNIDAQKAAGVIDSSGVGLGTFPSRMD